MGALRRSELPETELVEGKYTLTDGDLFYYNAAAKTGINLVFRNHIQTWCEQNLEGPTSIESRVVAFNAPDQVLYQIIFSSVSDCLRFRNRWL